MLPRFLLLSPILLLSPNFRATPRILVILSFVLPFFYAITPLIGILKEETLTDFVIAMRSFSCSLFFFLGTSRVAGGRWSFPFCLIFFSTCPLASFFMSSNLLYTYYPAYNFTVEKYFRFYISNSVLFSLSSLLRFFFLMPSLNDIHFSATKPDVDMSGKNGKAHPDRRFLVLRDKSQRVAIHIKIDRNASEI
jgi:hypothetical protein